MPDPQIPTKTRRQVLKITAAAGVSLAVGGSVALGLLRLAGLERISSTRTQMGTLVTVTVIHPDATAARALVAAAFAEMARLEGILSRHQAGTALDRLNSEGILHDAPPELLRLLTESRRYSELTEGAFDSTVLPLLWLYEASAEDTGGVPERAEIEEVLSLVDYRAVRIDDRVVTLSRPGAAVTLDGIAKGYVVDRAAEALVTGGAEEVMVEAGGDVAGVGGAAPGGGWRLGVQDPRNAAEILGVVRIRNEGVATAGDYMQAFTDDLTLHHIVDPRTGRSPEHASGVTVVAPTAMEADALSTSVFILGPATGLDLLERLEGCEGLLVTKEGETHTTTGFSRYLA